MKVLFMLALLLASATAAQAQCGVASYYGEELHGHRTASGERFNKNALTAAHRSLPFNSVITVVNQKNGKSVTVRISDRGPFVRGRILDLSEAAAREIGIIQAGTGKVCF